ncbi:MAG: hypothetical protein LBQ16_02630, partial [Gracilibacteraceae bacterium]|nr:hypothetical protein [Gracilibacteraceae bacterium]
MSRRIFHRELMIAPETRVYLERPRLNKLLAGAVRSPLITVCAGAGYGKTQAVYSFLRDYDATTTWVQLTERDNTGARFWENFAGTIALYNKQFGMRLLELGFPETDDDFEKYLAIPEDEIPPTEKQVLVFDDFHLISEKSVLRFIERSVHTAFPNVTTILISRAEPDINTVGLLSKGLAVSISENDLRFTEEETTRYFHLLNLALSSRDVANIYGDTAGWAFAVSLVGLSLQKAPSLERNARAAMKLNIFKLIENEVFLVISERLRRFLIRLSLIDHLAPDLIALLAGDDSLVAEMQKISSFVRYDIYMNVYLIHHLFLDYLRKKQDLLSEEEKRGVYALAARWCDENDYKMDAIAYYDKAGEYEPIVRITYLLPLQIPPDQARFILGVCDSAPTEVLERIVMYHFQRSRLIISLGRYQEALDEADALIDRFDAQPPSAFNNRVLCGAYLGRSLALYMMGPQSDVYDFDESMKKADYYFRLSPYDEYGPVTSITLNAWASKVGTARSGAMENFIGALARAIPHAATVLNGCMYGLDDLARGELLFYRGDLNASEKYIRQALYKAESRRQYEVRNRSLFYLLRIGVAKGDPEKIQEAFSALEAQLEMSEYSARFTSFDTVAGWYYIALGQHQFVASWLKGNLSHESLAASNAVFSNLIKARFNYASRRYVELLTFLDGPQAPVT